MAEIAAIGLAASIVSLIDFGGKVVSRLYQFEQALPLGEDPKFYRDVRIQLPLLLHTLGRTKEQAEQGKIDEVTQRALMPVTQGCYAQITQLNDILNALPTASDSPWRRSLKTINCVRNDRKFSEINERLKNYLQVLTYHEAASFKMSSTPGMPESPIEMVKSIFMVPFERDDGWIPRSNIMRDIDDKMQAGGRRVAITGIGGIGKSQIAIEYCYQYRDKNPDSHVFWVHAASIPRLRQAYKLVARQLQIPGWDDLNVDIFVLMKEWLSDADHGSWLMVLDGADDMGIFFPPHGKGYEYDTQRHDMAQWLPRSSNGSMLITSKDRRLGERLADRRQPVEVKPMSRAEASSLFDSYQHGGESAAQADTEELLAFLGNIPLAITQAAAFISENDIASSEYLEAIKKNSEQVAEMLDQDMGDHRRYAESGNSILSTWSLSFNQILEQQPLASDILSLMAVLDLYSVPKYLLIPPGTSFSDATSALGILKAFSMISVLQGGKSFEMHRLVQLAVRQWLEMHDTISGFQHNALLLLSKHYPVGDFENFKICEELTPHVQVVLEYGADGDQLPYALLTNNVARFDSCQARYAIAHERFDTALKARKKLLGNKHPDTLQTASYFGEVLFRETQYQEGERVMRYALNGSEEVLGFDHELTRMNMGHLAEMLTGQGRFDESEELFRRALQGKEKDLGTNLSDLKNADNFGGLLRRKEEFEEAEAWIRRSMLARESSLGATHIETIRAANHLGLVLQRVGRYDEAEIFNRRALAGFEAKVGREHHYTLQSLYNLSEVLRSQRQFENAEVQSRRAYEGLERLLGPEHRHTLQAQMSLALALKELGKLDQAEDLAKEALDTETRTLGEDHPQVKVSRKALDEIMKLRTGSA